MLQIFEWWYFRKYGTSFIEQVSVSHLRPLLGGMDNSAPSAASAANGDADSSRQSVSGEGRPAALRRRDPNMCDGVTLEHRCWRFPCPGSPNAGEMARYVVIYWPDATPCYRTSVHGSVSTRVTKSRAPPLALFLIKLLLRGCYAYTMKEVVHCTHFST